MVSSLGTYAAVAAVKLGQPDFLFLSVFFAMSVAVSALVARRKGQGDKRSADEVLKTALTLSVIMVM